MEARISGSTILTCLLGHPVAHSISPKMHNTAFQLNGLDYAYLAFDATEETFGDIITGLKAMNCRGFNLTMPFKTTIIPYLDELSPAAALSHSVNTVVNDNGRLIGHSTDGVGYMESVKDAGFSILGKNMTLLGAGGAATSICVQAALDGVKEIYVFKRRNATFDKVQSFCDDITAKTDAKVFLYDMADAAMLQNCLRQSAMVVNATNVGMGDDPHSLIPKEMLYPELIVSDIIYHPAMTPLLRDAAEVGCPYFNGEYMLLYQGAEAFRLWTGTPMPIDDIKKICFC
jgi:shikimate dehydrogenase